MAAVHGVISFVVPDGRLDRLASFEQSALFIGEPLVLAPVFDLDARVVLVNAPVAQVCVNHLGLNAQPLHQDGALLDLLVHAVAVIRVTGKNPGAQDQNFRPGVLQQLAVGAVSHGFLLHPEIHDHAGQFFLGNQLERDGHLHGADQQFF